MHKKHSVSRVKHTESKSARQGQRGIVKSMDIENSATALPKVDFYRFIFYFYIVLIIHKICIAIVFA